MAKKHFADFWDLIGNKKAAKKRANYVQKPISQYSKRARKILELGVGIGNVLIHFAKRYDVYGLDKEKRYVHACKKRIPDGKFFVASMHNFKINEKFDVIFSVHDSMNFLKSLNQWKMTLDNVDKHLNENGLFVFDAYSLKALKDFKKNKAKIKKFSEGYIIDRAIVKNNTLTWDFRVFEKIEKGRYNVHRYLWKEKIFPVEKINSAVNEHFKILQTKQMERGRRILFICRKK